MSLDQDTTITVSRALMEALAPEAPLQDGESGCGLHCNSSDWDVWRDGLEDHHEPDCPWVRTRRLLGDDRP